MTAPAARQAARPAAAHTLAQRVTVLHVDKIQPNPANVREALGDLRELAASIRAHGILQPLIVQPHPRKNGTFQLLAGHRRLEAAIQAGLETVPVVIRHGVDEATALELMLVENCQRADLNPMDRAEALGALIRRGYSQTRIAERTGMSLSWVNYNLSLLDLDKASRERVRRGELGSTAAVTAVRRTRRTQAKKQGSTADYSWEPDYLAATHPLAKKAGKLCDAREHTMRRRIGKTACGQCWETVIREDERLVQAQVRS